MLEYVEMIKSQMKPRVDGLCLIWSKLFQVRTDDSQQLGMDGHRTRAGSPSAAACIYTCVGL